MTKRRDIIERALDERETEKDRSLRGQALRRATEGEVPNTLTPWEWEEWYEKNGVPDSHRDAQTNSEAVKKKPGPLRRFLAKLTR